MPQVVFTPASFLRLSSWVGNVSPGHPLRPGPPPEPPSASQDQPVTYLPQHVCENLHLGEPQGASHQPQGIREFPEI